MPAATFSMPPLPLFPNPLDALPAAVNHLLAAESWARAQLMPHVGKTLAVTALPLTIRMTVTGDGHVVRATSATVADTTVTLPASAFPRIIGGGIDAVMRDVRIEGDADFAQVVSSLVRNLRWDVEEDLSKVVGDAASHRVVAAARSASAEIKRTGERLTAGFSEYLLDENPQLVRPHAVASLADGIRKLRDDLARLEKRADRLALTTASTR